MGRGEGGAQDYGRGFLYPELFKSNSDRHEEFTKCRFPCMEQEQQVIWEAELTMAETKKALSEMGSWKAPVMTDINWAPSQKHGRLQVLLCVSLYKAC